MPMYHVGQGMSNPFVSSPPRQSFKSNSFTFGPPPQNNDFFIDGLGNEFQPQGFNQPVDPFNQQLGGVLNNGAQIRVKKVYHLSKGNDLSVMDKPQTARNTANNEEPFLPTPPPCNCQNCLNKKAAKSQPQSRHNRRSLIPENEEQCDCHACSPRKFCKCADCTASSHDPNCTCFDCRPDIYKKKAIPQQHHNSRHQRNNKNDWYDDETIIPTIETPFEKYDASRRNTYAAPPSHSPKRNSIYSTSEPTRNNTGIAIRRNGRRDDDEWTVATESTSKMWYQN